MPSMNALKEVMQPPECPLETPYQSGWNIVEAKLGIGLPDDYKEFITCYGSGAVDDFIWVLNPFSKNKYLNLLDELKVRLEALRELHCYEPTPYPLFPDANGIFPWGVTDNGDVLYWICDGLPSTWPIVVKESRGPRWREFKLSTSEFLKKVLTRELVVDVFPDDFPSESPEFTVV